MGERLRARRRWPAIGSHDRREEPGEDVRVLAEDGRQADPAADRRENGENDERHGHRAGRLVEVVLLLVGAAELAEEGQRDDPEHVEGRQAGGEQADRPEHLAERLRATRRRSTRIASLEKKPASGGMPAIARVAIRNVA